MVEQILIQSLRSPCSHDIWMEAIALQLRNIYGGTPLQLCSWACVTETLSAFAARACCVLGNRIWLASSPGTFHLWTTVMGFHCIWLFLNWMLCNSAFVIKMFMFFSFFHFRFLLDLFCLVHSDAKFCWLISKHSSDSILHNIKIFSISGQMASRILGVKGFQTQSTFQTSVKMGGLEVTLGKVQGSTVTACRHTPDSVFRSLCAERHDYSFP